MQHELSIHLGTIQKGKTFMDKFIIKGELEYDGNPADPEVGIFEGYYEITDFKVKEITDNRNLRIYHPFIFPINFMVKLQEKLVDKVKQCDKNVLAENSLTFYQ